MEYIFVHIYKTLCVYCTLYIFVLNQNAETVDFFSIVNPVRTGEKSSDDSYLKLIGVSQLFCCGCHEKKKIPNFSFTRTH